jgi:hypothetical protein
VHRSPAVPDFYSAERAGCLRLVSIARGQDRRAGRAAAEDSTRLAPSGDAMRGAAS